MNTHGLQATVRAPPAWSPAWILPFESAFNWLQKYAWANVVTGQVLLRDVLGKKHIQRTSAAYDLLAGRWSHTMELNLPRGLNLTDGFVSHLGEHWPERFARGANFRFCPTCLEDGYHSLFHQFDAISRCPIHGDALRVRCSRCDVATPAVSLNYESFERPFTCTGCDRALANSFDPRRWLHTAAIKEGIRRAMQPLAVWLQTLERDIGDGFTENAPPLDPLGLLSDAPSESTAAAWFEIGTRIVPCPLPAEFLDLPQRPIQLRRIDLRKLPEPLQPPAGQEEADSKRSIVKSVRRYLKHAFLSGHEQCIREAFYGMTVERFHYQRELHQTPGLCPLAATYVRWVALNRSRGLLGQGWGDGQRHAMTNLAVFEQRSAIDPDRVLFAHRVLAEFFACAATAIAFDWHWDAVMAGKIDRSTMNQRLVASCVLVPHMGGVWGTVLGTSDSSRRQVLLARADPAIVNRLQHRDSPRESAHLPWRRPPMVQQRAPMPTQRPPERELWNTGWANPYESAWCLVQKYAIANRCKAKEICQWISEAQPCYGDYTQDLLYGRGLRRPFPMIAPGVAIRKGTLLAYAQRWRCDLRIECKHLRFCPECINFAYHSALHQILEMETCAIHRVPLLTRCSHCDGPTMSCHLRDSWIKAGFNCRRCHSPLGSKSADDRWETPGELRTQIEHAFGLLARWIRRCERTDQWIRRCHRTALSDQRFRSEFPDELKHTLCRYSRLRDWRSLQQEMLAVDPNSSIAYMSEVRR